MQLISWQQIQDGNNNLKTGQQQNTCWEQSRSNEEGCFARQNAIKKKSHQAATFIQSMTPK